jgi:hypothetical protein
MPARPGAGFVVAGVDTVRGIAFQLAQALGDVIDLVVDSDAESVVIEGADDVVDYGVLDRHGRRLVVRQAKTRREPGTWGATELAKILCAWGKLDDAGDAEFAFVTDASLNDSGRKLDDLIQAMRVRPDEAVLRQTAATLGRDGVQLPSIDVLRRVQILTRMGTTERVLAQARTAPRGRHRLRPHPCQQRGIGRISDPDPGGPYRTAMGSVTATMAPGYI